MTKFLDPLIAVFDLVYSIIYILSSASYDRAAKNMLNTGVSSFFYVTNVNSKSVFIMISLIYSFKKIIEHQLYKVYLYTCR